MLTRGLLRWVSWILFALGFLCLLGAFLDLRQQRMAEARAAAEIGQREMVDADVKLSDLFRFDNLKEGDKLLVRFGLTFGAGSVICFVGLAAIWFSQRKRARQTPPS